MKTENILIGYGKGVVTAGEITEVLLWPLNETLIRKFLSMAKRGEINRTQALKLIRFLRKKAQQHFDLIYKVEGVLQTVEVH